MICQQGLEYAEEGYDTPPPQRKKSVQSVSLSWWWHSYSGDLEIVYYLFPTITPRFTLIWSGSTWEDHIYWSNTSV